MIFRYLERRKVKALFGEYLSAADIETVVSKTEAEAFRMFMFRLNPFRMVPPEAYAQLARMAQEAIRKGEAAERERKAPHA